MTNTIILTVLDEIRTANTQAYSNIVMNIETIHHKIALNGAEQALCREDARHFTREIPAEKQAQFADYLGFKVYSGARCYFVASRSMKYGVAFVLNKQE